MEAIVAATASNAQILRRGEELGTIEAGKFADPIAVAFDPLDEPKYFDDPSRVRFVLKEGSIAKETR